MMDEERSSQRLRSLAQQHFKGHLTDGEYRVKRAALIDSEEREWFQQERFVRDSRLNPNELPSIIPSPLDSRYGTVSSEPIAPAPLWSKMLMIMAIGACSLAVYLSLQ